MAKNDDNNQDYLAQFYNLQQQYLNNLQQMMQPPKPANPMEQMWQAWMPGSQTMNNPFAQMQNPLNDWMQTGMSSFYERLNEQFKSQLQNPFAASMWPGMQNPFDLARAGAMTSPVVDMLQGLFGDEEREKGEALIQSLQDYQHVSMQISQLMTRLAIECLEQLQQKTADISQQEMQNVPQWWLQITESVLEDAKNSEDYQQLQQQLEMVQQKLLEDREQYRESLAESMGLVTEKTYQAMQMQIDALQQQIEALSANPVDHEAVKSALDDFTVLKGVGEKFNEKLHEQGIKNLSQLASMSDEMLKHLDTELQTKGKVFQDSWREQAEQFLQTMSGQSGKQ